MNIFTIGDIKRTNLQAGRFFFSRDTMRSFESIIYRNVNNQERNVFFADSSAGWKKGTRDYHVRYMNRANAHIGSVNNFSTKEAAIAYLKEIDSAFDCAVSLPEDEVRRHASYSIENSDPPYDGNGFTDICVRVLKLKEARLCF